MDAERKTVDVGQAASWEVQSASWRSSLNIPNDFCPWTPTCSSATRRMPKRVLDLIDCTAVQVWKRAKVKDGAPVRGAARTAALKDVLLDVSQNQVRRPFSNEQQVARCLTSGSKVYSFQLDRCLLGVENFLLQGYPAITVIPDGCSDSDARSMAGEAIALPSLATLVWAVFVAKQFGSVEQSVPQISL